jgi:hypothetical protein
MKIKLLLVAVLLMGGVLVAPNATASEKPAVESFTFSPQDIDLSGANTTVDLKGTFPFQTGNNQYTTVVDPIAISQKDISGLRTNLGFQLHLAFLRVYGSYSLGAYKSFSAGLGLGIGK